MPEETRFQEPRTGMVFLRIQGGCFTMGDTFGDGFPDERPTNEVCVTDFFLGQYPVTQGEWRTLMDNNPSVFKKGDRYPVEMISWDAAVRFIERLNRDSDGKYRLPTEAEWEYAARSGGKREKWSGTSDPEQVGDYMWFESNARERTHPVGLKKPNGLGLYDMSGLTHEWAVDYYHIDAYQHLDRDNPVVLRPSGHRAFRGGSWKRHIEGLRCTRRMGGMPHLGFGTFGLRIARDL